MLLYTAAHGGFSGENVPLGGGAAVCDWLAGEWSRTRPFEFHLITPAILGQSAPRGADLVSFGERDYANFSSAFERAATAEILKHDPAKTVVLSNDISEGPDFAALARAGFRVFTIYHVDVVAYVAAIYGRGWIAPETTVRWYRRLRPILPSITRLIWEKQEASAHHSRGLIVPSAGMREVLLRCYPECPSEKIHVLPWGVRDLSPAPSPDALRREFGVPDDARVLLTLSRISPEKGQDVLLESLLDWDPPNLWIFICGGAAYMQGRRFEEKLRRLAAKFRRTRVFFPGHVTGERKRAFFALADLYIFPSRHESYGLTLLEALAAGVPAVCLDSHGARSVMREDFGVIVNRGELCESIENLLRDEPRRRTMSNAAREFASQHCFTDQAAHLAGILTPDS
ncbi:MAG TPA: glycosyltransferase family 4 protein [Bryobacteraceae bacterium]|nr:glycosyltransferase family 4 protein [Bryobacteraceae bacterium]